MTAAVLRPVGWRDIPALAALEREIFPADAWREATWWAELAQRPRRVYSLAAAGQDVAGYAGLDVVGEVADVMTVAVAPRHRGTGLGARLLQLLLEQAARDGARRVLLEVRANNDAALGLYARAGFRELHRRRGYYGAGVDALVLGREVDPRG